MRFLEIVCALLSFSLVLVDGKKKHYNGHVVLKVEPTKSLHVTILRNLARDVKIDFWSHRIAIGSEIHMMVPPEKYGFVKTILEGYKIANAVYKTNAQEAIDAEQERLQKRFANRGEYAFDIDDFNKYEDTMQWAEDLKNQCASGVTCTTYSIGQSLEGRDLKVLKISSGEGKKGYWIDSAIHAREWLSPATVNKIANHLVVDYPSDSTVKRLVDAYDWYIMFIMNPDGYVFSFSDDRYWRKNRRQNEGTDCYGVDLNRNYNIKWGNDGSATDPCSQVYQGTGPASEPETVAHQNEANRLAANLTGWLTVHTYAQMWIFPFGHTDENGNCARTEDYDQLMAATNAAADAVENTHGTRWKRGNTCEVLGASSGATDDYVKGVSGVPYAATPELRGPDFVVPPSEIQRSYEEVWNGLVALVNAREKQGN